MLEGDKAYQGRKNINTPYKKPRKGELTSGQKARNKEFSSKGIKEFSSKGIFVEHFIRLVKIFRVAQQRFPLNSRIYEQVILTICGLVTLGIGSLVLPIS
jgi:hypothetical protein